MSSNGHATHNPPETRSAVLVCRDEHRPQRHKFVRRDVVTEPDVDGIDKAVAYSLVFSCVVCETERVWGSEEILP
jgi:hypothetical protein